MHVRYAHAACSCGMHVRHGTACTCDMPCGITCAVSMHCMRQSTSGFRRGLETRLEENAPRPPSTLVEAMGLALNCQRRGSRRTSRSSHDSLHLPHACLLLCCSAGYLRVLLLAIAINHGAANAWAEHARRVTRRGGSLAPPCRRRTKVEIKNE